MPEPDAIQLEERMRIARRSMWLLLGLFGLSLPSQTRAQTIAVTGKLVRMMVVGAESTGWAIEFDSPKTINGKQMGSIQVSYANAAKLDKLAEQRVRATGKLSHRHGVETGEQAVLEISSIKRAKTQPQATPEQAASTELAHSEWVLQDLNGGVVLPDVQATLAFPEAGKVTGHGSCNRFFGSAEITGSAIKLSAVGSTRMTCSEAVMAQETKYLEALRAAERFEAKDQQLLIYCRGFEKPLRFARVPLKATP